MRVDLRPNNGRPADQMTPRAARAHALNCAAATTRNIHRATSRAGRVYVKAYVRYLLTQHRTARYAAKGQPYTSAPGRATA